MDEKQHINLQLDTTPLSLHIDREKEPFYREAASMLNRRYKDYQRKNPNATAERLWMYVALEVAVNLHSDARDKQLQPVDERLQALNKQIQEKLNIDNN